MTTGDGPPKESSMTDSTLDCLCSVCLYGECDDGCEDAGAVQPECGCMVCRWLDEPDEGA